MENRSKKKIKSVKTIICTASLVGVLAISGVMAYLTDTKQKSNNFVIGKVQIELQEPSWNPTKDTDSDGEYDMVEDVLPNVAIPKDPQIENTGNNSAYVYLKVITPIEFVVTVDDNGNILNDGEKVATELFTYEITGEDWEEIVSEKVKSVDEKTGKETQTRVFSYKKELEKGQTTSKLFKEVKPANVVENQIELNQYTIEIEAYAIQTKGLPEDSTRADAYQIFKNQNKDISTSVGS